MKKPKIHTLNLTNELEIPVTLWLMPWGRDYTMLPGDKFVVEAASFDEDFDMTFSLTREGYYVYTVGNCEYAVVLDGSKVLELGHNRDKSPVFPK
jgi:hypothetical protein